MSVSVTPTPGSSAGPVVHAWWLLLLVALALLWLATARRIERVEALTARPAWSVDAPRRDASSPTGYAQGQRRLIVPGHHNPSFWWIREAQLSAEQGRLRLRHIDYDAVPEGRDIRRTAPYRWWLIAVGWLSGMLRDEPLGYVIERGALFADPLLLALLLTAGATYCARSLGPFAAAGFVVGGISLFPLAANFQPGAPDPHSLAWVCALGSVLPLLARSLGRAHCMGAGIFGGLGFWNDATSQAPVLLAVFLGALGGEFVRSRGAGQPAAVPAGWRTWAVAGSLTTLAACLLEFSPGHLSWSLDAVNPLHAVAWWGLGEMLHAAGIWFREGRRGFSRRSLVLLGAAGLAIVAWPVAGSLSGSGALLAPDFYALELANHPRGGIAPNLGAWLRRADSGAQAAVLLPCGLLLVLGARIVLGGTGREERARLVFALVAALFVAGLACRQLRWWNLFDVLALAALAALFAGNEAGNFRMRWGTLAAALLVLPGLIVGFPPAVAGPEDQAPSPLEAQTLIERDFAYWLARRAGAEPNVVFSTPIFSGAAAYYGGFDTVVSSDHENKTGYLAAVRIASAGTEQELSVLVQSRRITHVAIPLWDPAPDQLVRIGMNLSADQPLPRNAFAVALREWDVPLWMRPMDYLIPHEPGFQEFELRVFAVQAEQEPDLGLSRLADFFVERGQLPEARAVRESLKAWPRSVAALGAIAGVDLAVRDGARLKESLDALTPALARRAARNLPADRRISLAALFFQTGHADLARDHLTACLATLDIVTLRALTPGALVKLMALSRSLQIPFPDRNMEAAAMELIPPGVRTQWAAK